MCKNYVIYHYVYTWKSKKFEIIWVSSRYLINLVLSNVHECTDNSVVKYQTLVIWWWNFLKFDPDLRVCPYMIKKRFGSHWMGRLAGKIPKAIVVQPALEMSTPMRSIPRFIHTKIFQVLVWNFKYLYFKVFDNTSILPRPIWSLQAHEQTRKFGVRAKNTVPTTFAQT